MLRLMKFLFRLSSVCLAWLIMLTMPGRAQNLRSIMFNTFTITITILILIIINLLDIIRSCAATIIITLLIIGLISKYLRKLNDQSQVLCMWGQFRHPLWPGQWRGRNLQFLISVREHKYLQEVQEEQEVKVQFRKYKKYKYKKYKCKNRSLDLISLAGVGRRRVCAPRSGSRVQRSDQQPRLCQAVRQQR